MLRARSYHPQTGRCANTTPRAQGVVNSPVGFFQPIPKPNVRLPAKVFLDHRVVTVAAIDALGRFQIVGTLKLDARDCLDDVHQSIDGYNLVAPEVDRLNDVAGQDRLRAFEAIIDIHKTSRLAAIAPNLDFMFAG